MTTIPRQTRIYAAILAGVTLLVLAVGIWRHDLHVTRSQALVGVLILAIIVVVEQFQIDIPSRTFHFSVSVGSVLALGAAFALPPLQSLIVVVVANVIVDAIARLRPIQLIVNGSNLGLSTFVASVSYGLVSGHAQSPLDNFRSIAATIVASTLYNLVNVGALSIIVGPVIGETPRGMFRTNFSGSFVFLTLPMLGSLVPITSEAHPWGVLILTVPLAGAYYALRMLKQVELEAQATIVSLMDALEFRDEYTHRHSSRVTQYVEGILLEMPNLPSRVKISTVEAARVHDVGKVGIRDTALLKNGPLTEDEFKEIKLHPVIGADIVQNLEMYRNGASIVRHHHERWDGKGYPDGLKGEDIPLGARIIAVADSFDAMTSDRPYRRALSHATALAEIERNSGIQFDPQVVEAFKRYMALPATQTPPHAAAPNPAASVAPA
jgi:HD-GYP domain-containing protein (c-di-GMP phosphodiesterase class II)